jgi:hypothetical protein
MGMKSRLEDELKTAMRQKDEVRRNALRMALSSIKLAEVEQRQALDDAVIISILQKEIKTREETITEARNANRSEMIAPNEAEIQVLKEFLPAELSDSELQDLLKEIIAQSGASSIKEMGVVMKAAIPEVAGRASNDRVSKMIRELLSNT